MESVVLGAPKDIARDFYLCAMETVKESHILDFKNFTQETTSDELHCRLQILEVNAKKNCIPIMLDVRNTSSFKHELGSLVVKAASKARWSSYEPIWVFFPLYLSLCACYVQI